MSESENEIAIRDLVKIYDKKTVVDHLTLTIAQGECFALLGVNGAGKSTTIKMLCGLVCPDGGDAVILGHSVRTDAPGVKRLIGVSPQETAVAPNLTVEENLALLAGLYHDDKIANRKRVETCLQELSLEEVRKKPAKKLSGGWQRRLSIAMALIGEPKVLFLDEPTLGLDVIARRELWHVIAGLKGRVTVLLTTHYLEEAEAMADRIAVMAHGRLKAVGSAAELCRETHTEKFEDAFLALAEEEEKTI